MAPSSKSTRKSAVRDVKRTLILDAALTIFERDGLESASMRAIGDAAGYTAAAIYFHFESKEAIYAALLEQSLDRLIASVSAADETSPHHARRFEACALAFFDFYSTNPRDLDLGFYLFRGGMRPRGLSPAMNARLNAKLLQSLAPIVAASEALGAKPRHAQTIAAEIFAYAVGLLVLQHTGRSRLFDTQPRKMMLTHTRRIVQSFEDQ